MTREEKDLIYNAILGAYGDNCMGGKYYKAYSLGVNNAYDRVVEVIRAMPPTEKRGHWTDVYREVPIYNAGGFTETRHIGWQCSECNKITPYRGDYCGDCGSYNKEGDGE